MTWHAFSFLLGRTAVLFAVAALFFLALMLPYRGWDLLREPARRILSHPSLAGLRRQVPGLFAFLKRHFHDEGRSWLRLLLGAAFFAFGVRWFVQLLHGVLTDSPLVVADHRLHNTVALFHSPALHRFYSFVSDLTGPVLLTALVAGLAAVLWIAGRRREAFFLAVALAGASLFSVVLKPIVRARPRCSRSRAASASPRGTPSKRPRSSAFSSTF
jgi:hypothetical protein